ncbi:MAG: flagellar biosynthetic protein FliQ [Planctomycetota bacterium]
MPVEEVVALAEQMLWTAFLVSLPLLATALVVGVFISILQTVTGVQEMTLTFVPKIAGVVAAVFLFLPWMVSLLMHFTETVFLAMGGR